MTGRISSTYLLPPRFEFLFGAQQDCKLFEFEFSPLLKADMQGTYGFQEGYIVNNHFYDVFLLIHAVRNICRRS